MKSHFNAKKSEQKTAGTILMHQVYEPEIIQRGIILLFPAFEGWSGFLEKYAAFFAEKGFVTVAVDYYGGRFSGQTLEQCLEIARPFLENRAGVRERAINIFQHFQTLYPQLNIGAMGFCLGVQFVLELARTQKELKAAVGAHGLLATSNLMSLETINSAILMMQGYSDPMVPTSECLDFASEMERHYVQDWNLIFFGKAQHSFTDPKTGSFDPEKEKALGRAFDSTAASRVKKWAKNFFKQTLQKS